MMPPSDHDQLAAKQQASHVELDKMDDTGESVVDFDAEKIRKIRRKIDLRLLPILVAVYTMAFLDRVNLGNARLWHLERDLGLQGNEFNIGVMIFYIPYILCGIPFNMILTYVGPRYWISGLAMGWGLSITFLGFASSKVPFYVVRILLGVFEAGVFPACMYSINTWYTRYELATRMSLFMIANDIAGISSGFLGAGLGSLDGTAGYSGWSWICFVEGGMTVVVAIAAYFILLDFPEKSTLLPPDEKQWLLQRLAADSRAPDGETRTTVRSVLKALCDWKVIIPGILYLACCTTAYSIAVFQPTILATFGWDSVKANLLSAPLRVASGITMVSVGYFSDRLKVRGPFIIGGYVFSCIGAFCVAFCTSTGPRYMGLWFAGLGVISVQPTVIGWGVNQLSGVNKRSTVTGFASSFGQVGGIISAMSFPKSDGPQYVTGNLVNVGISVVGIVCAAFMSMWSVWENRQRAEGKRDHLRQLPQLAQDNLGEKHPDFRFTP